MSYGDDCPCLVSNSFLLRNTLNNPIGVQDSSDEKEEIKGRQSLMTCPELLCPKVHWLLLVEREFSVDISAVISFVQTPSFFVFFFKF